MSEQPKKLVEQSDALTDFFESLMRDVDAYDESADNETNTPVAQVASLPDAGSRPDSATKPVAEKIPQVNLFETLPSVEHVVEEKVAVDADSEVPIASVSVESAVEECVEPSVNVKEEAAATVPEWHQHEFQAMLFKVAGLTLAVPLVDLNGVIVCELDNVVSMPGHSDFYLGLLNHLGKNVPLVDTARFVLPAEKMASLAGAEPHTRITRAVMINDCQYGLACDEVNEVINLSPDEVRWRTQRTQRRWLAGTVVEHMCALIDASAFAELLAAQTSIQDFQE